MQPVARSPSDSPCFRIAAGACRLHCLATLMPDAAFAALIRAGVKMTLDADLAILTG